MGGKMGKNNRCEYPFFRKNFRHVISDQTKFFSMQTTDNRISDTAYRGVLTGITKENITFKNISFNHVMIEKSTFKNCNFENCEFVGAVFRGVEIHKCNFLSCNFFRATFCDTYVNPDSLKKAIICEEYSNIAVSMYSKLRQNYFITAQKDFKNESEYQFCRWSRKLLYRELNKMPDVKKYFLFALRIFPSFVYDMLYGYGYKATRMISTNLLIVLIFSMINYFSFESAFKGEEISIIKSLYFTLTTMITLGSNITPESDVGYILVMVNAVSGIILITSTANSIIRKVSK